MLGASQGPYFQYSEPFEVEAGKSYTVLMTDEDRMRIARSCSRDPAASSVRQNGSVRYFDIRTEPFGLLIPDERPDPRQHLLKKNCSFDHHLPCLCAGGCVLEAQLRQLLKLEIAWTEALAFQS